MHKNKHRQTKPTHRSLAALPAEGGVPPRVFLAVFALLSLTNILTLVLLFMSSDVAYLAKAVQGGNVAAYEDRIAELRLEVDRLHSRQYAQAGDINLQLQDLVRQQSQLADQHHLIRELALRAEELGLSGQADAGRSRFSTEFVSSSLPAGRGLTLGDIDSVAQSLGLMNDEARTVIADISAAGFASTAEILGELRAIGIEPDLAGFPAVGGPFEPPAEASGRGLEGDAGAAVEVLERFAAIKEILRTLPLHRPVAGEVRVTSGFGNRNDPFLNRPAFHAGIDYPAPTGTPVFSAGSGKVIFAGPRSGYGNLVEIEHGGGLVSRYAHLSLLLVSPGDVVHEGVTLGKAGSTGRSTGPHLHFEVRQNGQALDPARFMGAGQRLAPFLS